jgi:hypothetical protein
VAGPHRDGRASFARIAVGRGAAGTKVRSRAVATPFASMLRACHPVRPSVAAWSWHPASVAAWWWHPARNITCSGRFYQFRRVRDLNGGS